MDLDGKVERFLLFLFLLLETGLDRLRLPDLISGNLGQGKLKHLIVHLFFSNFEDCAEFQLDVQTRDLNHLSGEE